MVLSHTECFGHSQELSIYRVYSMAFWGQDGETFEGFEDVSWHRNVSIFLVAIPVNFQSTLDLPFKVH